jgi:nucleoside 2-deoxyribosyltransferase
MRVYVAGRTNNVAQVRAVQRIARDEGWEITHDWTQIVEEVSGSAKGADQPSARVPDERKREYAEGDIYGVRNADVVIVVCSPDLTGTLVEVGIAIERATPVWIFGKPDRETVFFVPPYVHRVPDSRELRKLLRFGREGS